MPLVRIDLLKGRPSDFRAQLGDIVYQALVEVLSVPENDRFQVIAEHDPGSMLYASDYLGITKTDASIFVQITLNAGRDVALKRSFYKALADMLNERLGLRREDIFINLVEVSKENWSFGNGEAQYSPAES